MKWRSDQSHSHLDVAVKHMGISTVRGRFKMFTAEIDTTDGSAPTLTHVAVTAQAASIDTGEPTRDDHLRSGDFFDAAKWPEMRFESEAVTPERDGRYAVSGSLTIRGEKRGLRLDVEVTSPIKDPWGKQRAAAAGRGKLNRKDWGLNWNKAIERGGWLVGDDVQFSFDIEAVPAVQAAG